MLNFMFFVLICRKGFFVKVYFLRVDVGEVYNFEFLRSFIKL